MKFSRESKNKEHGFTIVETLIAFAVGGLLVLIGFRMIPSLQRNSRNSERKQDVSIILQTISRWELNHSGNIPSTAQLRAAVSHLTIYESTQITVDDAVQSAAAASPTNSAVASASIVRIYKYQKCSTTTSGASTRTGAGYHDVVALFAVENRNSGSVTAQCQEL